MALATQLISAFAGSEATAGLVAAATSRLPSRQGSCENFYLKKFYLKISLKTKTSYGFFR